VNALGIAKRIGRTRCGAIRSQMSRSASAALTRRKALRSSRAGSPWISRGEAEDEPAPRSPLFQKDHPQAASGGVARDADAVQPAADDCKIVVRHAQPTLVQ